MEKNMKIKTNIEAIAPYAAGVKVKGKEKLSSNENPLGSSPMAIKKIQAIDNYSVYPDVNCTDLREAIALEHGVSSDNIIVGNGSDEVLTWPSLCLVGRGDNAITGQNTFSEYTFSTLITEGEIRKAPLTDGKFSKKEIEKLIDSRTKIIYVCNPNNPTGTFLPKDEILNLITSIPEHILVVVDEAYGEYGDDDFYSCINEIKSRKNLLILKTFSKIYGLASLRIGYAVADSELMKSLWKTKQPFNVNQAAQIGGLAAIKDVAFVKKSITMNNIGKKYLYEELDKLGLFYYKTQANFICINVKRDAKEVFDSILDQGMTIRACGSFGLKEYIRVTVGSKEQMKRFISYLKTAIND